jgi:hypothetical protein
LRSLLMDCLECRQRVISGIQDCSISRGWWVSRRW